MDLQLATAENHPDEVLDGMDEIDIALEAGWEGEGTPRKQWPRGRRGRLIVASEGRGKITQKVIEKSD